jgi:hypothetical protein
VKFWRNDAIEGLAQERLQELEKVLGRPVSAPVAVDRLAEAVLELDFLWDDIEELEGEVVLGAIRPRERLILLNERRRKLFEEKAGLENFTKGHEMGHWDLFVDKSVLDHPELFDGGPSVVSSFRHSKSGGVWILESVCREPEGQELLRRVMSRADRGDEARAVNRYAGAILTPQHLLRSEFDVRRPRSWPELYRLRDKYNVTISALSVRLQQLDLLYVDENGKLYESKAHATGQRRLI